MNTVAVDLSTYLSGIPNLKPEDISEILVQVDRFFEYCHNGARDPKSDDSAKTYRELATTQTKDARILHQTNQALYYWAEFHNRYLSPTPELDLLNSRPGFLTSKGSLSFLPIPEDQGCQNQIPLFPIELQSTDYDAAWQSTCNALTKEMQTRGFSWKTQHSYLGNLQRFQKFIATDTKPTQITWKDAENYLDHLLFERKLSSASIRSATFGLKYWFVHILHSPLDTAFKKPMRLKPRKPPVVFSKSEVNQFLAHVEGKRHILFSLLYGCGMRLSEGLCLRIKDIDFENRWILVLDGKGRKGRHVPLPEKLVLPLRAYIEELLRAYDYDLHRGIRPWMPASILRKGPSNTNYKIWQWLFPAESLMDFEGFPGKFRWHSPSSGAQRCFSTVLARAQISKHASSHTLRHSFATHLIQNGVDIKTLQRLLGHSDMQTTAQYLHVLIDGPTVQSPLDFQEHST